MTIEREETMIRRRLIAGNWKMNKTPAETEGFIRSFLAEGKGDEAVEILLLPPFVGLELAGRLLRNTGVALGGQNLHFAEKGAFTGEISSEMLKSCGCSYVLVGHSERRTLFGENDELLNRKLKAALAAGLSPILCVGETLAEHREGRVEEKVAFQLAADLAGLPVAAVPSVVIAYEPIWAIGTGETASPEEAQGTIHMIREWITGAYDEGTAERVRILYGGSVKPENAAALMAQPDIDGALVGGASLSPESFAQIIARAG
jgi:triosephosphate isomerase